ncbi:MAG TPA: glutathione S-transferase family protein [Devosia sp.]|jgi:glutathione S-transferase|nr:glutathione S-transferase family protein [Devosia sp.]
MDKMSQGLVLWGRSSSANVQKALWTLRELQLAFEHREVGGRFGGLRDPAFRALNPNGLVPVLQDGELTLWESHAIVRYIAAAYGEGSIWPRDVNERAAVDQWTDWTATTFQPAWLGLFWALVRTPPEQHNHAAIDRSHRRTLAALHILEGVLQKQNYLGGEELSYADIVAGVALYRWFTMPVLRPSMPGVEHWYALLQQRPAFRSAVMVDYSELVGRLEF